MASCVDYLYAYVSTSTLTLSSSPVQEMHLEVHHFQSCHLDVHRYMSQPLRSHHDPRKEGLDICVLPARSS